MSEIAPVYLSQETRDNVLNGIEYARMMYGRVRDASVFNKKEDRTPVPVENYIEEKTKGLRYILYDGSIKGQTSHTNTPENIIGAAMDFSAQVSKKPLHFIPQRLQDTALQADNFRNGIGDMIAASWDTETLELFDGKGKRHSMVMEFGFAYQAVGAKQFNKMGLLNPNAASDALISSGLIGITDTEMLDLMDNITKKLNAKEALSKDQQLVFDFISRIGDAGTEIEWDHETGWANIKNLTTRARGEYQTVENFIKGRNFFAQLGTEQLVEENGIRYNKAAKRMVDNLAYMASDDVNLVLGKNVVSFDIPRVMRDVINQDPYLKSYYENIIGAGHTFANDVVGKTFDLDEAMRRVPRENMADVFNVLYSGEYSRLLGRIGYEKQENMLRAAGMDLSVSHAAGVDAWQYLQLVTAKDGTAKEAMDIIFGKIKADSEGQTKRIGNAFSAGFQMQGSLFQAKTNGGMSGISKYQGFIAGAVRDSSGNIFFSNNVTWNEQLQQYVKSDKYAPGLWNKDMTYTFDVVDVINPDSITDPLIQENARLNGEDLVHIRMSMLGAKDGSMDYLAKSKQRTDIFVPKSVASQFIADNFGAVALKQNNGSGLITTEYGKERIKEYVGVLENKELFNPEKNQSGDHRVFFRQMNIQRIKDNAERSLNKFSKATTDQVLRFQKLINEGTFAPGTDAYATLYDAIVQTTLKTNADSMGGLKSIAGSEEMLKVAQELANGFNINGVFNESYLQNVRVIAHKIEKGSLLEQFDGIITNAAKANNINLSDKKNVKAYSYAMKNIMTYMRQVVKPKELGRTFRVEDQRGLYYLTLDALSTKRSIGRIVEGTRKDIPLTFHFDNASKTLGAIMAVADVPEHLRNDKAYARDAVMQIMHMIADSEDGKVIVTEKGKGQTLRSKINEMFLDKDNPITRRNPMDIVNELTDYLKQARELDPAAGTKTTEYYETLRSFLLKGGEMPEDVKAQVEKIADHFIKRYAEQGNQTTASMPYTKNAINEIITGDFGRVNVAGYSEYSKKVLELTHRINESAAKRYSAKLVENIEKCGGKVHMAPGNQILVDWGDGQLENIMDKVVTMHNNSKGIGYFQMGPKGTKYSMKPILRWANPGQTGKIFDPYAIMIDSPLNLALDMYTLDGRKTQTEMERRLAAGESGKHVFDQFFLKKINGLLRESPLAGNSMTLDYQNAMAASVDTLFYARDLEKRIPEWQKAFAGDSAAMRRISRIEEYVNNINKRNMTAKESRQFMQDVAAMGLFTGNSSITHLIKDQDFVRFTTDYKKSSSGLDIGIGDAAKAFNRLADPGKQTSTIAANSSYFVVRPDVSLNLIDPTNRKNVAKKGLNDFNINFGARYATSTENELMRFTDKSGVELTNALQVPVVETNRSVKEEILKRLAVFDRDTEAAIQTMNMSAEQLGQTGAAARIRHGYQLYAERARDVVANRLNITEGGGMYNGYLTDLMDTSWGTQVIRLNGREVDFGSKQKLSQMFRDATAFSFNENGEFQYGNGYFAKFDQNIAKFQAMYGTSESTKEFAKNPSIWRVEYMSKDGKGLVTAQEVQKAVEAQLASVKDGTDKVKSFTEIADSLFDKVLVGRSIYETDYKKMLFDEEKHVGASSTAFLRNLMNEDAAVKLAENQQELWANPAARETLLNRALHTKPFDKVVKRNGTDWRGAVALNKDVYDAIANLDFDHAVWRGIQEDEQKGIQDAVIQTYLNTGHFGEKPLESLTDTERNSILGFFADSMKIYRNSINDPLYAVTNGGMVFGESMGARAKHHDMSVLVDNTVDFIQRALFDKSKDDRIYTAESLKRAITALDQCNALRIQGTNESLSLAKYINKDGTGIVLPETSFKIDTKALEEGLQKQGFLKPDQTLKDFITNMRDFQDGVITPHIGTMRFVIDDTTSLKTFNITDREMSRMSSRIWNQDIAEAVEKGLKKDYANQTFVSKYLAMTDLKSMAAKEHIIGEELIDYMFTESAFASFKDNAYGKEPKKGVGSSIKAAIAYNEKRYKDADPYRDQKTKELIDAVKKRSGVENYNPYVSQEFADNMYIASSAQAAREFNSRNNRDMALESLRTDWGKNKSEKDYFQAMSLKDDYTRFTPTGIQEMSTDPSSPLRKNTVWNMTDADIGLTTERLGQHSHVAVAGISTKEFEDLKDINNRSADAPQKKLERVYHLRSEVAKAYNTNPFGEEYENAVNRYIEGIQELEKAVEQTAQGKQESSAVNQIRQFRMPGSISNKVNVTDTTALTEASADFEAVLGDKTYMGESLKDLSRKGKNVNYMIIGEKDLEKMGFDEKYFKKAGITREAWLQKARTEGVAGVGHRWPSIYWGSDMAVQVYVSDKVGPGETRMDAITAAFMKADSDGDRAQLFMLGATQKNGQWVDELSLRMAEQLDETEKNKVTKRFGGEIRDARRYVKGHTDIMLAQQNFYNDMIKKDIEVSNQVKELYSKLLDGSHTDLSGTKIIPFSNTSLSKKDFISVSNAFMDTRDQLVGALESIAPDLRGSKFDSQLQSLKEAVGGDQAFLAMRDILKDNGTEEFRSALMTGLGDAKDSINQAYEDAYALFDADAAYLQRIAKGGAGVIDNPFTASDLLRREALTIKTPEGKNLISARESFAIDMVREHLQEDFLTPKQATFSDEELLGDLNRVTDLHSLMFSGKASAADKTELANLMEKRMRPTSKRYNDKGTGMLQYFMKDGTVDDRKIIETYIDSIDKISGHMSRMASQDREHNFSQILQTTQHMVRANKMHLENVSFNQRTIGAVTQAAINDYRGDAANIPKQISEYVKDMSAEGIERARAITGFSEKITKSALKGGSWSKNALLLAGAVMLTGFVGGNPATPTQQQAREQYNQQEENPPQTINLADPSLSVSGRKQPGYVININAQTQKDKDYASRVITQAVTRNYQNTNVNVSMNVNQQPGNISGKEIADYLRQVF